MDHTGPIEQPLPKAEQPIRGAEAIAEYIFGNRESRRKVYYLAEKTRIPIFRLGATLCMRPSAYRSWLESQEARATHVKRDA